MSDHATLRKAILYFSEFEHCKEFMVNLRWPKGVVSCPVCGSEKVTWLAKPRVWKCYAKHSKPRFSLKTGTIFEDSPIALEKWLPAVWMILNCKNGISSWELHRAIGVTQKTAWFMLHRIRLAMQSKTFNKLGGPDGPVEIDETFIGGKKINMHRSRALRNKVGTGGWGKAIVLGMLQRGGNVSKQVIEDRTRRTMQAVIRAEVEQGSELHSVEHAHVWRMDGDFVHKVVNHIEAYVQGNVHTNGLENFWSLLKRALKGTYVSVEPFHLHAYVDEQAWRYNNRVMDDGLRFVVGMRNIVGKRLTYAELTGKEQIAHG
jgi:transposase-like protein